ncbi:MAG TPA: flagellar basal body rod protein FlgB [Bacteroidota bacterium]|nr:flagellar basal body rod protein FlgB [Bacteroidota bacterium]
MKMFDDTKIPLLSKALTAYSMRHKAISSNIANIATVGYRSQSVSFENQLAGAMSGQQIAGATTNPDHIQIGAASPQETAPSLVETDGNGSDVTDPTASGINDVDIDREMTELAKNQLRFKFASRLLSESFKGLQKSIRGQQ